MPAPRTYMAFFTQEADGTFSAEVPQLPGCYSQGDTLEEVKQNIREAMEAYLESRQKDNLPPESASSTFVTPIAI